MSKVLKELRAGRLVTAVLYTQPSAADPPRVRRQKEKASTAARERLNARTSYAKLANVLGANFDDGDLLLTLTFDDKHLPEGRSQAQRKAQSFLKKLRAARKARGQPLDYVYVIEGCCPGGRPHIHAVVNATGEDVQELRALWRYGTDVDVKRLRFDDGYSYLDLASYLTKEPREWGHPHVGERNWTPSLGLARPEPTREVLPDGVGLAAPPGAVELVREGPVRNGYGEFWFGIFQYPHQPGEQKKKVRAKRRKRREADHRARP